MRIVLFGVVSLWLHTLAAQSLYRAADIPPVYLTGAHAVVRVHETRFTVTAPDEADMEEWMVVTLLNKEAESEAVWTELENEFEKVKSLKGSLYDADGNLVKESKKQDVLDVSTSSENEYSNTRVKALQLEYGQYPYTVEFRVKKSLKGFFRVPDFVVQKLARSVLSTSVVVSAPTAYVYTWKGLHVDTQPVVKEADGMKTLQWTFANVPAVPKESFHPYFDNEYCKITIAPKAITIDGHAGNFSNWNQIGAFFYELNKDRDVLSADMEARVQALIKGKQTTREKIDALYKYLQQNYRYVSIQIGIGGWQTLEAGFVEKKKYGDCKALTNYMHAMLKSAGIESYMANIYAGADGAPEWNDDAPVPYANHVILYIPSEKMWLECTSTNLPTGYLGDFTSNRKALVLMPDGGHIMQTPVLTRSDNARNGRFSIRLDETGAADVQGQLQYTGELHEPYRDLVTAQKQADQEKTFIENADFPVAQLNQLKIESSESSPLASIQYALKANSIATRSGKRMFVPVSRFKPFKRSLPSNDKRILDLQLRETYALTDTFNFQLPAGYSLENLPSGKRIESEFGLYELRAIQEDQAVRVIRHIEMLPVLVPAARYEEVRRFYLDVTKADGAQMVLVKP